MAPTSPGIIAADSTSVRRAAASAWRRTPRWSAISIGEVLFTTAVVTAYDHMLDQPDLWGIDVVNNSWGNSFRQFDPRDPVHVVTKAVADLGVVVVFAAGNSGDGNVEMSLNPFSQAPWVLSVAAGTLDHQRGDFSSNGLAFDNSQAVTPGAGGHTVFTGDRIGIYHPDCHRPGRPDLAPHATPPAPRSARLPAEWEHGGLGHEHGLAARRGRRGGAAAGQPEPHRDQIRSALQATRDPGRTAADGNRRCRSGRSAMATSI